MARKYFRPEKPAEWNKKETTWLDSFNLEDVMNQYEDGYDKFEFIGPVPIDFADPQNQSPFLGDSTGKCIVDELCKLDLKDALKKGTERIGIIFNLDKHDEPGSHTHAPIDRHAQRTARSADLANQIVEAIDLDGDGNIHM
jgi:hypothetical protein